MKYALIFRKLIVNNIVYYQAINKVSGIEIEDNRLHVTSGIYENQDISSMFSNDFLVYFEIAEDTYQNINVDKTLFFKKVKNQILPLNDLQEENSVLMAFYRQFRDFRLIPDYDLNALIEKSRVMLEKRIVGQDKAISKILKKIYNNQMFFQSDLDYNDILRGKSNILVLGPLGTGKSTIKDILMETLDPIPVVSYSLTGNYQTDITEIIQKLYMASDGNLFLAEHGIVVFDDINKYMGVDLDCYLKIIKQIVKAKLIYLRNQDNNLISFDYSKITNICIVDNDYDYDSYLNEDCFYTRISEESLEELGLNFEFLNEQFDGEIVFMEEMTYDLALKILKNKDISPLYAIKRVLELQGKKVRVSKNFVSELINYGLGSGDGFTGIVRLLKSLFQSKDLKRSVIYFQEEDFQKVNVGTILALDEDEEYLPSKNVADSSKYDLKVNVKKGTINNLTVLDTVLKIKENIKGQDEQIFFFVNAFYEHIMARYKGFTNHELNQLKSNVLLIGPTGVGKTAIVSNLARIFNLPFQRAIAPRYSQSGYVGANVDSILNDLVEAAGGDIKKAEQGILYIDEVDKISATYDKVDMGLGVQHELLTLIEGDKRTIKIPDMFNPELTFDTSNLFVVATGAFDGLDKIVKQRVKKELGADKIGFTNEKNVVSSSKITSDDLCQYGFDRQFVARFPNRIRLNNLNEDIFYQIVNDSKDGYIKLVLKSYQKSGVVVSLSEGFKRMLAKKAFEKKEGVRAIKGVFEDIKAVIDYNIQTENISEVILDENSFEEPKNIIFIKKRK